MRQSDPPILYIVGTPKGRLSRLERKLLDKPWQEVRPGVQVKLLPESGERYILAQSVDRVNKERAMRRRQLKRLWYRLQELGRMKKLKRDDLLLKLGAAKQLAPRAWRLVTVRVPKAKEAVSPESFTFRLRKDKLRQVRRREGRYLLRTNLEQDDPGKAWHFYMQLSQVEEAFKNLKGDLAVRPLYHQLEHRIEAHIFVSFLAYCVHVSLREKAWRLAPGLSARIDTSESIKDLICRPLQSGTIRRRLRRKSVGELRPQDHGGCPALRLEYRLLSLVTVNSGYNDESKSKIRISDKQACNPRNGIGCRR